MAEIHGSLKIGKKARLAVSALSLALTAFMGAAGSNAVAADKSVLPVAVPVVVSEGTKGFGTGLNEGNHNMIAAIKERGVINVGVRGDIRGLGFYDKYNNRFSGLEVAIGKEIAKALGVQPHFVVVASATRTELLDQGVLDLVMGTMTITKQRQRQWDFSAPYYKDSAAVLTTDPNITSLEDLLGKSVGVTAKTNSARELIRAMVKDGCIDRDKFSESDFDVKTWKEGITFKEYQNVPDLVQALDNGSIAAFCNDRSLLLSQMTDQHHLLPETFAPQPFGIATPKDTDLSVKVKELIDAWIKDGTMERLYEEEGLTL